MATSLYVTVSWAISFSLSPILFNIFAEAMLKNALCRVNEGARVGGHLIKTVSWTVPFVDDQAALDSSCS